ncbi:hypothetical protein [Streptomyces pacificus]|uniref:Uncharacterized protein n=1 Tax=Streptomyces pacificus TaxID=2705029 RepID=A0A6A0B3D8_9ACTN|nr:hypothetical protein [Streptomyces pacificus]GFH39596.1 hypothetical protein SCWH03_58650 [Streptomyces pacificus]
MIDYTAEEIRRLLHQTLWHVTIPHAIVFAQSLWRRAHQAVARRIHYERHQRQASKALL